MNANRPSGGSGLSWSTAFNNIEEALEAATKTVDSIWLKGPKTYIPDSSYANRSNCFKPNVGVKIYGGFKGTFVFQSIFYIISIFKFKQKETRIKQ